MDIRKKKNKAIGHAYRTIYKNRKFDLTKLDLFPFNEKDPRELGFVPVKADPDTIPQRYSQTLRLLLERLRQQMHTPENQESMYILPPEPFLDFVGKPKPLITLWYIFCVLVSCENIFPLTKEYKYIKQKNSIFFCILDKHYLREEPCNCMADSGIDLVFHWEAKNRHFEIFPEDNDKRKKYLRTHYYFVFRTPFPLMEEMTLSFEINPDTFRHKFLDFYVQHGYPLLRFFETRAYWVRCRFKGHWFHDLIKYKSTNVSNVRAEGTFIH